MKITNYRVRGSVAKNVFLITLSAGVLVAAGVIVYGGSQGEKSQMPADVANAPVKMRCADCGAEWTIKFAEWDRLSREAIKQNTKVTCKECDKAAAWNNNTLELNLEPPNTDFTWRNDTGKAPEPRDWNEPPPMKLPKQPE